MKYKFDHDWFSGNIPGLELLTLNEQVRQAPLNILEIGAFEGRSTCWFIDRFPNASITTIDTWKGGADHSPSNPEINFTLAEHNFSHNIGFHPGRVRVLKTESLLALSSLLHQSTRFDLLYVDGSHEASDVLTDLILAFNLMNSGALIYCDDYLWGFEHTDPYHSPKLGIDAFATVFRDKLLVCPTQISNNAAAFIKK